MAKKLAAVRRAAQGQYPSGDIDTILGEIEAGYTTGPQP
jgi:hypothetical protein